MMWNDGWSHGGGSWMGLVLLFALLAPLVAAFVVVRARDHGSGTPDAQGPEDEPERILRRRFAAGEIDEHEFVACLTTLRGAAR